jgi:hypothetical protein
MVKRRARALLDFFDSNFKQPVARMSQRGAHSRDPLAHAGYNFAFSRHYAPEFCKIIRPNR